MWDLQLNMLSFTFIQAPDCTIHKMWCGDQLQAILWKWKWTQNLNQMSGLLPNMASTKPPLTLSLKVRTRYSLSMDTRGKGACLPQQNADREKKEKQVFTFTSTYLICNGTQFRPCKRKLDRWVKCQALTVFFICILENGSPGNGIAPLPRVYM